MGLMNDSRENSQVTDSGDTKYVRARRFSGLDAAVFNPKKLPVHLVLLGQGLSEQAFVFRRKVIIDVHRLFLMGLKADSISR